MTIRVITSAALSALTAVAIAACSSMTSPAGSPTAPTAAVAAANSTSERNTTMAGATQSASGNAHVILLSGDAQRTSFNAVKRANGVVTGQWELFTEQFGGVRLHGTIECLQIQGTTQAIMAGPISQSTDEVRFPVGVVMWWAVNDRGEGGDELPDLFKDLLVDESGDRCENEYLGAGRPVLAGNIQVRP